MSLINYVKYFCRNPRAPVADGFWNEMKGIRGNCQISIFISRGNEKYKIRVASYCFSLVKQ